MFPFVLPVYIQLHIYVWRITAGNSEEGEWNTHCTDCIPLAIKAKQAERERPTSAKVRMVLKLLCQIDESSNSEEKTIIFSQFTSMLDLLEPFLEDEGIKYVRCKWSTIWIDFLSRWSDFLPDDGSMTPKDREASLSKIRTSSSTRVILISFKAGSTGRHYVNPMNRINHWISV